MHDFKAFISYVRSSSNRINREAYYYVPIHTAEKYHTPIPSRLSQKFVRSAERGLEVLPSEVFWPRRALHRLHKCRPFSPPAYTCPHFIPLSCRGFSAFPLLFRRFCIGFRQNRAFALSATEKRPRKRLAYCIDMNTPAAYTRTPAQTSARIAVCR